MLVNENLWALPENCPILPHKLLDIKVKRWEAYSGHCQKFRVSSVINVWDGSK